MTDQTLSTTPKHFPIHHSMHVHRQPTLTLNSDLFPATHPSFNVNIYGIHQPSEFRPCHWIDCEPDHAKHWQFYLQCDNKLGTHSEQTFDGITQFLKAVGISIDNKL